MRSHPSLISTLSVLALSLSTTACVVGSDELDVVDEEDSVAEDDAADEDAGEDLGTDPEIINIEATVPTWIDAAELDFVNKVNALRKSKGLPALRVSVGLTRAANEQVKIMIAADAAKP